MKVVSKIYDTFSKKLGLTELLQKYIKIL